jgi:hypothetical protein
VASSPPAPAGAPAIVSLGANGGSGNDGGAVELTFSGGFTTLGDDSVGLFVQSIGAGGGQATVNGLQASSAILGGQAGAQGDGGDVTVSNDGRVLTYGKAATGILVQSIGGGGGAVFGAGEGTVLTLSSANQGDGGTISLEQKGDVVVLGDEAYGVLAQSLAGGGGLVSGAFAGSAGGVGRGQAIDLHVAGSILAPGADATAVLAQSLGSLGGGNISINASGHIRGGSAGGVGVALDGGADNLVTVSGSLSAVSGKAMTGAGGNDRLENNGLTVGNIWLGGGRNLVHTAAGATFRTISTLDLRSGAGSTGLFSNDGLLLMGLGADKVPVDLLNGQPYRLPRIDDATTDLLNGVPLISVVALDGDFRQSASGSMAFDVAFGPYASDRVDVTGSATVAGTGEIVLTWLENAHPVTLFATAGQGVDNGLAIADTLAVDYRVLASKAGIQLAIDTNFGAAFLNRNGRSLGGHMDSAIEVGDSSGIGRLAALVGNLRTGEEDVFKSIMTEISPEPHVAPVHVQLAQAQTFGSEIFGCAPASQLVPDGDCAWSRLQVGSTDQDASAENFRIESNLTSLHGGFQRPLEGPWSLAFAVGYDMVKDLSVDNGRARSDGNGLMAGIGFQRAKDNISLGYSVSGGLIDFNTKRQVNVFGPAVGDSDVRTSFLQGRFDAAWLTTKGRLFAKPQIGLSVTALRENGFEEEGLAGVGIKANGHTAWIASLEPDLALGAVVVDSPKHHGVFTLKFGGRLASTDELKLPFRFIGAGPGSRAATMSTPYDQRAWRFGSDLTFTASDRLTVRLSYTGEYGDTTTSHRGGLDLNLKF